MPNQEEHQSAVHLTTNVNTLINVSLTTPPLQLYILKVSCRDGSTYFIYRRYRQFDEIQNALEKRFPIEAGAIKAKDRTLPFLPSECMYTVVRKP